MSLLITILGSFMAFYLVFFVFGSPFYKTVRNRLIKAGVRITPEEMPVLRPLPIKTSPKDKKKRWVFTKTIIWFFAIRQWRLEENFQYKLADGTKLILHKGFEFDGASVPRPLWALLSPVGLLLIQGLIHDYGYRYQQLWQIDENGDVVPYKKGGKKKEWDKLFKQVGREVNGMAIIGFLAYLSVRWFGCFAWENNRALNASAVKP